MYKYNRICGCVSSLGVLPKVQYFYFKMSKINGEKAKEFNKWLEKGASLYICGQKFPMSNDVENAIIEVISQERNISTTDAKQVLEDLETAGKYQKDVY